MREADEPPVSEGEVSRVEAIAALAILTIADRDLTQRLDGASATVEKRYPGGIEGPHAA
jgi:hypothetical protein